MKTNHGRHRSHDAPMPMPVHVGPSPKPGDRALVARYIGPQYVAEREGDELRVYAVNKGEHLSTVVSDASATNQQRLAALNRRFAEIYRR